MLKKIGIFFVTLIICALMYVTVVNAQGGTGGWRIIPCEDYCEERGVMYSCYQNECNVNQTKLFELFAGVEDRCFYYFSNTEFYIPCLYYWSDYYAKETMRYQRNTLIVMVACVILFLVALIFNIIPKYLKVKNND